MRDQFVQLQQQATDWAKLDLSSKKRKRRRTEYVTLLFEILLGIIFFGSLIYCFRRVDENVEAKGEGEEEEESSDSAVTQKEDIDVNRTTERLAAGTFLALFFFWLKSVF